MNDNLLDEGFEIKEINEKKRNKFKLSIAEIIIWSSLFLLTLIFNVHYWPGYFFFKAITSAGFCSIIIYSLIVTRGRNIPVIILNLFSLVYILWSLLSDEYSFLGKIIFASIIVVVLIVHLIIDYIKYKA